MVADFQNSGFHFTVPDVFKFRTIARLSLIRQTSSSQVTPSYHAYSLVNRGTILKELNLTPNSSTIEDVYPASYLQMGLLLENQLANLNGVYHTIFAYRLSNTFVSEKFFSIWEQLIKKHPLLRTSFSTHKTHSYCCIQYSNIHLKKKISVISIDDLSDFINKEKSTPFHLSDPGLFKIYIYSISDKEFSFIFSSHHAIEDGWSVASLIAEFSTAYITSTPIIEEKLPSYGEFVTLERQALSNQVYKKFWHNYLKAHPSPHFKLSQESRSHFYFS